MKVLHVVNYGWPYIDGYTVRSRSVVSAQRAQLGLETEVATSPFPPFAQAQDRALVVDGWGPDQHAVAFLSRADQAGPAALRHVAALERPAVGLAPMAEAGFRRGLEQLLDRVRPDVVHAHHPAYVGRGALAAARSRGLPMVYELRCFNGDYDLDGRNPYLLARGRRQNRLELALCRSADQVVTIADGLADRITAGGVDPGRVSVVRNAVDLSRFTAADRSGHSASTVRVGYATTFEKIEGIEVLVRAAALARGLPGGDRLRVEVAGTGRDHARIAGLVQQLGVGDTVVLPGFVPVGEMPAWYAGLDLFVVPRQAAAVSADTTPLKPLEALATGLPVLANDLPAMRELLAGRPGVQFAVVAEQPLAQALARFAEQPWGPAAPADLTDRSWAQEVRRYPAVYAAALEHQRALAR